MIPIFVLACFIPPAQRVSVAGLDFTLLRLLLVVGWLRVLGGGEQKGLRLLAIDRVILAYAFVSSVANIAVFGSTAAVVYNLGITFDVLASYFLVRVLVRNFEDVDSAIRGLIWIAIVVSVPFLLERYVEPHRNIFSVFGGIDEITSARQGKVRAQGAFPHSILAGCFWAATLPLILAHFWTQPGRRALTVAGLVAALLIIFACASSTPLAGAFAAIGAAAFFRFRRHLRLVRWGTAFGLLGLHLVMKAPVWHLVSRIDLVGGSTGWHRYHLIDQAIKRFPEWGLIGTRSTAHWGYGLFDVTSQYVYEGVRGGILTLALFVATIALAYRGVGRVLRATPESRSRRILAWMLGAALFTHMGMFIAVSYFGQMYLIWYFTLAAIASLEEFGLGKLDRARWSRPRRRVAASPRLLLSAEAPAAISSSAPASPASGS